MNVQDSDWLARALESRGWEQAPEDRAQVFIINTCSVREKPELKVYSALGRVQAHIEDKPDGFAVVGGCVAQQIGKGFFDRFDFVRVVFGADGVAMAPDALERAANHPEERIALLGFMNAYPEREEAWPTECSGTPLTAQAQVNIMQGCDNFCTYCIVPYVRGRQKSRQPESVVQECRELVNRGVREINLLGQNVNSFGQDLGLGSAFAQLLREVAGISGLERLRFTTSHPKDIDPDVIRAFGELENLCPQLHLPMQCGSDRILKRMGRKYDMARYLGIVRDLKIARPEITLTTDLIVGFPGETEEDFEQTLAMVEKVGFESSFSFKYSDRPGVAATRMEPKVDPEEAARRLKRLQDLQNRITRESLEKCVGHEVIVLYDRLSRRQAQGLSSWMGRDPGGRIVNVDHESGAELSGMLGRVIIHEAKNHSLSGEKVGAPW